MPVDQALRMAVGHHQAGRLDQAAEIYAQILAALPDNADANNLLGVIAHQRGDHAEALRLMGKAIEARPNFSQAHSNLGLALQEQGRPDEALASHRRAVALAPESAEAHHNLGITLRELGQGMEAIECHRQALALRPDYTEAQRALGNALREEARLEEAAACFKTLSAAEAGNAEDHNILGIILRELGQVDEAVACYRRALSVNPGHIEAEHNLGHALLLLGEYGEGWQRYEKRFESKGRTSPLREFKQPLWNGAPLNGRTIFLHAEQGFGDAIQFIRYARTVAEKYGGRVIVECQPKLKELFTNIPGIDILLGGGETVPDFNVHAPLMSLPQIMDTRLDTIPCEIPYISTEGFPIPVELAASKDLKVGFLWAGNIANKRAKVRTVEAGNFDALVDTTNTEFYSLQFGEPAAELETTVFCDRVTDLGPHLVGFAQTAAVVAQLDLIITIDTYLAHLAGAMGKPVWVLLSHSPDWRWLLGREDSPWYPTARLFRQPERGDWPGAIGKAQESLEAAARGDGPL